MSTTHRPAVWAAVLLAVEASEWESTTLLQGSVSMEDGLQPDETTLISRNNGQKQVAIEADGTMSWPIDDDDVDGAPSEKGHSFVSVNAAGGLAALGHEALSDETAQVRVGTVELHDDALEEVEERSNATLPQLQSETQCLPSKQLGMTFDTPEKCAAAAAADSGCTAGTFMYPVRDLWSRWGCKCCYDYSEISSHSSWNLYEIPAPTTTTTAPPTTVPTTTTTTTTWPDNDDTPCDQENKQKSIYAYFDYEPTILSKPATEIRASVTWDKMANAEWRQLGDGRYLGGVYAAYVIRTPNRGPAGYFGAQLLGKVDSLFLFSMWDSDRWEGSGHDKYPKPSSMLVWPLSPECSRNCNDCGLASLQELRDKGLTSGTKCVVRHAAMANLGKFSLRFYRKAESYTINTVDYGGFAPGHNDIGEYDREVTGSRWVLEATSDATGETLVVGDMLFEGATEVSQLRMFDELIGCTKCNDQYHKDTREGPFLHDADGTVREPTFMHAQINGPSSCLQYHVSGDKAQHSITFEAGPPTVANFEMGERYTVW